jgi:hypothetical protein
MEHLYLLVDAPCKHLGLLLHGRNIGNLSIPHILHLDKQLLTLVPNRDKSSIHLAGKVLSVVLKLGILVIRHLLKLRLVFLSQFVYRLLLFQELVILCNQARKCSSCQAVPSCRFRNQLLHGYQLFGQASIDVC